MLPSSPPEAQIRADAAVLVPLTAISDARVRDGFLGTTLTVGAIAEDPSRIHGATVYLWGPAAHALPLVETLRPARRVFLVGAPDPRLPPRWEVVAPGRVPLDVHGVGILFRRYFEEELFDRIQAEHAFQTLTESTKPGRAHRTGLYLTPVTQREDGLHFHLLRCSTNLSGPTDGFRATDHHIVDALQHEARDLFDGAAPLNHVLAQVYHNTIPEGGSKPRKARIKDHADKTKDMPVDGIMAFCTFYDDTSHLKPLAKDPFDLGHGRASGLTRLIFRLKKPVAERPGCTLPERFTVPLYPGSVFLMPLSTNRLYTHAISPPSLNADRMPTRMGYVVRCSSTPAVHAAGRTSLVTHDGTVPLEPPTPEGMEALRHLYAQENHSDAFIGYGARFRFSMNRGDYEAPTYTPEDEFRRYSLDFEGNPYASLLDPVRFQQVTKGREGAVLVLPDPTRGVPIVRTTTPYDVPAQRFADAHERLAVRIARIASLGMPLNNALIERYTLDYTKMGPHSDQALDLAADSHIALFSCYADPDVVQPRTLLVTSKMDGSTVQVPLLHGSVVVFSTDTNRRFKHRIVLDRSGDPPENPWLGLTFRTSRTFVQTTPEGARLEDGTPLTLANEDQRQAFFRLRGQENREVAFTWPELPFTISPSDLLAPVV